MLNLICGSALPIARAELNSVSSSDNTLFVVPDELTAGALTVELRGGASGVTDDPQIIAIDVLINRLTSLFIDSRTLLPDIAMRATVRNIIESNLNSFDYLVGRNSVPHMSQGVLDIILKAMDSLRSEVPSDDGQPVEDSPRWRQLKLLVQTVDERLIEDGLQMERVARMQAIVNLHEKTWTSFFPHIERVVFLDFLDFSDILYLTVAAVSRLVNTCDILLEFDPESESLSQASLESVYQRLFDMADRLVVAPENGNLANQVENYHEDTTVQPIVIVEPTLMDEVRGAGAVIKKLLDDAEDGDLPRIVIALPNWNDYAAPLEKELDEFGITAAWYRSLNVSRSGSFLLLERLSDCSVKTVTGKAVSRLLRSPGFPELLNRSLTGIEAWDVASRLDYILTFTGQLTGWSQIQKQVPVVLKRLQADRKRQNQWSEEEGALDAQLLATLDKTADFVRTFSEQASIAHWCDLVLKTLASLAPEAEGPLNRLPAARLLHEARSELMKSVVILSRTAKVISKGPVMFRDFIALFRTAIQHIRVDNTTLLQRNAVIVCSPILAEKLRSDCCIIPGCNDGSFPRFARPEASFSRNHFETRQTYTRSRQHATLNRIMRNHNRVLLWMPQKVGTEDMLPSQFVEELINSNRAIGLTSDQLLHGMKASRRATGRSARMELVENLAGLQLTPGELSRFAQRGESMHNIASGISITAHRSHRKLSVYDGIITDPRLKDWLAEWANRHIYSVSQLDAVVGCSFRFFADRMLNLEELDEADDLLPSHIFGSFTHDVLARFYRVWVAEGRKVPTPADEGLAREKIIEAFNLESDDFEGLSPFARDLMSLKLFGELGAEGFGGNFKRLDQCNDPGVFGQFLIMEMGRGSAHTFDFMQPSNFEVGFGMGAQKEDDPLSIPEYVELDLGEDEKIKLRGRIDRIDISPAGVFAVTDYKTGKIPEKRQILGGFRTQLPVYIMVARQLLQDKFPAAVPAGGLYYSLKRGVSDKVSGVFFRSAYHEQAGISGRSCMKDEDFDATVDKVRGLMLHSLRSVRTGYLTTTRHDPESVCAFCAFEGLCYRDVDRTAAFWDAIDMEGMTSTSHGK